MKKFISKIKGDFLLSSILSIVMGILMIVWGDRMLLLLGRAIGLIMILIGIGYLLNFFVKSMETVFTGIAGAVIALVGLWIFLHPASVVSIVPIVMGMMLIFHGIKSMTCSFESRNFRNEHWWIGILLAIIDFVLGIICIMGAFQIMTIAFAFIGIALIYSGVANLWVLYRSSKAQRSFLEEDMIDVEFKDE